MIVRSRCTALMFAAVAVAVVLLHSLAHARLPSAGAPMTRNQTYPASTHSWFVMPAFGGRDFVLAHVPPRAIPDGSARASAQGLYRSVLRLSEAPEALAAWDDSVYAVFTPRSEGAGDAKSSSRTVRTLRAKRFSDSDLWIDDPSGRMDTLPNLPGIMKLAGFAAGPGGPIALLADERAGEIRLLALIDRAWREIELPSPLLQEQGEKPFWRVDLAADARGIYLVGRGREAWTVWSGGLPDSGAASESGLVVDWEMSRWKPSGLADVTTESTLLRVDRRWYAIATGGEDEITVFEVAPEFVRRTSTAGGVGPIRTIVPIDGLARLMIVSTTRPENAPDVRRLPASSRAKVTELSLLTGRVFYEGPAQPLDPLGSSGFRFLAVGLVLAMGLILVLVLRSDEAAAVHLPEGCSFAEPMRRCLAGVVDIAIIGLVIPRITGNSLMELLGPMVWLNGEAFETLLLLAVLGCAVGTVGEAVFGRTPGKLITDCEVISIVASKAGESDELPRPDFRSSLIRNAIKWFLFPVAVLALMDGSGRHRGDQFAKAAVIVRFETEDEPQEPDDEM